MTARTEVGTLTECLQEICAEYKNPIVVMATAGRDSVGDFFLGSHAERVVRTSKASVLALPKVALDKDA